MSNTCIYFRYTQTKLSPKMYVTTFKYSDRALLTGSFLSYSSNRFPDFQITAHAVPSHKIQILQWHLTAFTPWIQWPDRSGFSPDSLLPLSSIWWIVWFSFSRQTYPEIRILSTKERRSDKKLQIVLIFFVITWIPAPVHMHMLRDRYSDPASRKHQDDKPVFCPLCRPAS